MNQGHIYCSGHKWSKMVCNAFAEGSGLPLVPAAPLLPGDVFMYGALRGLLPTLNQAKREGRTWYYADNGYFKSGKTENSYFRITRNALQHDGSGDLPFPRHLARERWKKLGLQIQPWRRLGAHIIVCPPGRLFGATFGFSADDWLAQTLATLRKHTKRELRVRQKMSWNDVKPRMINRPLADDLQGAWALVTHSSNSAVEALLAGVPVFCTASCGASALAQTDLSLIEAPLIHDNRPHWAAVLASNQWSLAEMKKGLAWEMLNEIPR